jgi:transposase-like protein
MEELKARTCNPADCNDLSEYLFHEIDKDETKTVCCSFCGSSNIVKHGTRVSSGQKTQRYRCKACHHESHSKQGFSFRMKHSNELLQFAQRLGRQTEPAYSTRDIAALIQQRFGIKVSHATISAWLRKPLPT